MKLKLTLTRATKAESDIVVTADAAASVGDVARTIAAVDPQRSTSAGPPSSELTLRIVDRAGAGAERWPLDAATPLAEAPLGSGATVEVTPPVRTPVQDSGQVAARLVVISGPDAGAEFALPIGTHYLGRDAAQSDVTLRDPLVSKRHARIEVFAQSIRLVDLNSANGIEVDGGVLTRVDLEDAASVRLGDTVLEARIVSTAVAVPQVSAGEGPVGFNRSPRVETRYPGQKIVTPQLPTPNEGQPFPWLVLAAPLILGPVMFAITQSPFSLIFMAMSPLLVAGNFASQAFARKRKRKLDAERFDDRMTALEQRLGDERALERSVRQNETPTTGEVYEAAMRLAPPLWTRRPEHWQFLTVNLGRGILPSRNELPISNEDTALPEPLDRLKELIGRFDEIDDVPVAENLHFAGALGVVGPTSLAAEYARSILVQLTGLHSPSELVVASLVSPMWTPEFEWLKWLPHTGSVHSPVPVRHLANSASTAAALLSSLEELIATRKKKATERGAISIEKSAIVAGATAGENGAATSPPPSPTPAVVVLISDDAPVDRARLVQMAEDAADAGVFPIWVAAAPENLPAVTRTFVTAHDTHGSATVGLVRVGRGDIPVQSQLVTREQALAFARRLAPVFDASAVLTDASDLPRTVSMLSLLGPEIAERSQVAAERWRQNDSIHDRSGGPLVPRRAGRLRALVGQSAVDAMHLDLRTQGPHALVGGTTGAGKSEFLQAWVLGMASEYSPDRVSFLFVDYKGGSAFADCVRLPHCVGLVTDLSPHLVRRALTSLRAELHHREHLFNRKKVKDLIELEKSGDPDAPPALILVIDEFAALAKEVPEFVDGVVDIAQRGRSLGIHLIMATQRPAGVIKDNLRANTNMRIALRMADESDSKDVVGDAVAAGFDPSLPGRGIAKTGPGRLVPFQSAYAGGWTSDEPVEPSIQVADLRFGAETVWEAPGGRVVEKPVDQGPTDQTRLVQALIGAARDLQIPAPRRPWLDELAPVFDITRLRQRTDTELVLGVTDVPDEQRQDVAVFRPDTDGHLAVYGTGGSGKTVALRTLAVAAGITPRGGPVDVYALDFAGSGLRMLDALPHVGSVILGDDTERVIRLLRGLKAQLAARGERYAAVNASTITEYRAIAGAPDERRILLLVDGFPAFRAEYESTGLLAPWYGVFHDIVTEGRQLGMHVAITADRPASVPTAIGSGIQRRVVLRLAEEQQYAMLDEPKDVLSSDSPPGRAVLGGRETQIAVVGGTANAADQSRATTALAEAMVRAGRAPAEAIRSLPKEVDPRTMPPRIGERPVLGVSDESLEPVAFEPSGVFLLGGPPASGRTSAVRWLVASVRSAHPDAEVHYFGSARSPLSHDPGWAATATTVDEIASKARELSASLEKRPASPKIMVVVESLGDYLSGPADPALVELIKTIKRTDHFLLAEGESASWASSWPLMAEVKNARTGLMLQPETMEGDVVFRTTFPRGSKADFPPGRGLSVARGRVTRVQLPFVG